MAGKNMSETAEIMPIRPVLSTYVRQAFEREAKARGVPARFIHREVINHLVRDNLFDAVIGEDYPVVRGR